jgi:hypothetical protein
MFDHRHQRPIATPICLELGKRRRSKATEANTKNLIKTDKEGRVSAVPIKGNASKALNEWLTTSCVAKLKHEK